MERTSPPGIKVDDGARGISEEILITGNARNGGKSGQTFFADADCYTVTDEVISAIPSREPFVLARLRPSFIGTRPN